MSDTSDVVSGWKKLNHKHQQLPSSETNLEDFGVVFRHIKQELGENADGLVSVDSGDETRPETGGYVRQEVDTSYGVVWPWTHLDRSIDYQVNGTGQTRVYTLFAKIVI